MRLDRCPLPARSLFGICVVLSFVPVRSAAAEGPASPPDRIAVVSAVAAERVSFANEAARLLGREPYKIDLSAVLSPLIGETERNLNAVFNRAEAGGAVLFFDEAEPLFSGGGRSRPARDAFASAESAFRGRGGVVILGLRQNPPAQEGYLVVRPPLPRARIAEALRLSAPRPTTAASGASEPGAGDTPTRGFAPSAVGEAIAIPGAIRVRRRRRVPRRRP